MLRLSSVRCGILNGVSLRLEEGACIAVSGPSGSGKTTLLNVIAGSKKYSGDVEYLGRNINALKPWQRPFRYLNQRLYLFPFLSLEGNLRLAQYAAGRKNDAGARQRLLEEFEIAHLARRRPAGVSGGEQQRAALARALVSSPRLLLLDEPFSSLDWDLRVKLWSVLLSLKNRLGFSMLVVTHEPKEAKALADSSFRMENGVLRG